MSSRKVRPATIDIAANSAETVMETVAQADVATAGRPVVDTPESAPPMSIVRTGHEQRAIQVRDLNDRIADLETRIDGMTGELQTSRTVVGETFTALEQRIREADALLRGQQERVEALECAQQELHALHRQLDQVRRQHGQAIDALTQDTRRRFEETHLGLTALNDICHRQQETLIAYRRDHEDVARRTRDLQWQIDGLDSALGRHETDTRLRFTRSALALLALAVISLGLIAWFQINPTAVPETVKAQLASLSDDIDTGLAIDDAMSADLARHDWQISTLTAADRKQARETAALRANDTHLRDDMAVLRDDQQEMRAELTELRAGLHTDSRIDPEGVPPLSALP